jgi:hypothetical protein
MSSDSELMRMGISLSHASNELKKTTAAAALIIHGAAPSEGKPIAAAPDATMAENEKATTGNIDNTQIFQR